MAKRFYVYTLTDPRDGAVFYVGKGCGSRINAHEREASRGVRSAKCQRIREIRAAGLRVVKAKVAWFASERAAYRYESRLINTLPGLTNGGPVSAADTRQILRDLALRAKAGLLRPTGPWGEAIRQALLNRADDILLSTQNNAIPAGTVGQP